MAKRRIKIFAVNTKAKSIVSVVRVAKSNLKKTLKNILVSANNH
jgi:hypothetical protein